MPLYSIAFRTLLFSPIFLQSMRNLVCRMSMSGKTCLRLVEILGLPVTMTATFVKFCSIFNDVTCKN